MDFANYWFQAPAGGGGYQIEQSLRFDGNGSKLVLASPSSSYTINKFTMSCWVKMGPIASDFRMMGRDGGGNTAVATWCNFNPFGNNVIASYFYTASINGRQVLNTLGTQRDPSAWYHIIFGYDSGSGNTQRIWVNGVEQTTGKDTISGSAGFEWSSTYPFVIGGGTSHGYCAEYHFIDDTWLDSPDDFGELNDQGVWVPKEYTGSHGTNGFYLTFDPSATNGIGHDHSGTGNHLTASGFTTSGTGTDVMDDTPTTNYATWSPLNPTYSSSLLSEGNLKVSTGGSTGFGAFSTIAMPSSGKYYFELTYSAVSGPAVGLRSWDNDTYYLYRDGGDFLDNGTTNATYGATWGAGDVIGCYYDAAAKTIGFTKNGVDQGTATTITTTVDLHAYGGHYGGDVSVVNFGQRAFAYTPPTGYKALNTANLPAPDIADGSDYFNTVLYTGDNTNQAITGVGFQPDLVWIKSRSNETDHVWQDAVRGAQKFIRSNSTTTELTDNGTITSFDSDGFTIGSGNTYVAVNNSGWTFAAWNWLAGGSVSADNNTDGSITSTVSANPSAGFSIVSYTGTGANATVGHGLGVAPKMIIVKDRDASVVWAVHHSGININNYLRLNTSDGEVAGLAVWNQTAPSSTVFSIGTSTIVNNTNDYIAYCFAEVPGYSSIGSYVGNNSSDGPFIYTGFRPAWVMVKAYSSGHTYNWVVVDAARNPYNVMNGQLFPNEAFPESTGVSTVVDFLSNGFKWRYGQNGTNGSGVSYVYAAFAEFPMGGSNVSPAPAR